MSDKTTIQVLKTTCDEMKSVGEKGETYDDIIRRTINFTRKFSNEDDFHLWFLNNFRLFGFDEVKETNRRRKTPDFVLVRAGKDVRVELETLSSNFIRHKHDPSLVDLVICLEKDVELEVETVEISPFEYERRASNGANDTTTLQLSPEHKKALEAIREKYELRSLDAAIGKLFSLTKAEKSGVSPVTSVDNTECLRRIKALPGLEEIRTVVREELSQVSA